MVRRQSQVYQRLCRPQANIINSSSKIFYKRLGLSKQTTFPPLPAVQAQARWHNISPYFLETSSNQQIFFEF